MPKRPYEEIDFENEVSEVQKDVKIKRGGDEDVEEGDLKSEPPSYSEVTKQAATRSKPSAGRTNDEGETYFELGPKKRITVRKWNNNPLVDIREYWKDKDNTLKPGKKGISLTVDQFRDILKYADEINAALDSLKK